MAAGADEALRGPSGSHLFPVSTCGLFSCPDKHIMSRMPVRESRAVLTIMMMLIPCVFKFHIPKPDAARLRPLQSSSHSTNTGLCIQKRRRPKPKPPPQFPQVPLQSPQTPAQRRGGGHVAPAWPAAVTMGRGKFSCALNPKGPCAHAVYTKVPTSGRDYMKAKV